MSLRSAKVLSCAVGRRGQKDRGGSTAGIFLFACVILTVAWDFCTGVGGWGLRMSSFFLITLKSSAFLSAWAPLTPYVSPAPASRRALMWLAGSIWALYSAFTARVFLVRRGTSIQCQILCCVFNSSSTSCSPLFSAVLPFSFLLPVRAECGG